MVSCDAPADDGQTEDVCDHLMIIYFFRKPVCFSANETFATFTSFPLFYTFTVSSPENVDDDLTGSDGYGNKR